MLIGSSREGSGGIKTSANWLFDSEMESGKLFYWGFLATPDLISFDCDKDSSLRNSVQIWAVEGIFKGGDGSVV